MSRIDRLDSLGMAELLRNFPQQIEEAIQIGEDFGGPPPPSAAGAAKSPTVAAGGSGAGTLRGPIEKIVFVGMGGSAIGGDVIRSLLARDFPLPLSVSRHYRLPAWVDSKTLCIFSSYSGNTEETLAGFQEGMKKKLRSVVITSGGELARLAQKPSLPWIEIPKGLPPRAALGYSVFPILNRTNTARYWVATFLSRTKRIRCSAGAALPATTTRSSRKRSSSSARRLKRCARRWDLRTRYRWCLFAARSKREGKYSSRWKRPDFTRIFFLGSPLRALRRPSSSCARYRQM